MGSWVIFTDLDGTLLDHDDYNFNLALPALEKINRLSIPLIINSSKTYAEIKSIRKKLHNNWAFAVENGAAVFIPPPGHTSNEDQIEPVILGESQASLLKTVHGLRNQYGYSFKGFDDYSVKELMLETGLPAQEAEFAKQRLASEPLKWLDSIKNLSKFKQQLQAKNLQLVQGGRFLHVMGQNDKSLAMAWIINNLKANKLIPSLNVHILAIGDSDNDTRMLQQADYAGIIRRVDGSYLELNKKPAQLIYSLSPAPLGWQEVMDKMFNNKILGAHHE